MIGSARTAGAERATKPATATADMVLLIMALILI
jgi:hypothetical protein